MTDKEFNDLRDVYWTLETDQASAADYKRIVDQRLSKPYSDFGSPMTQIREEKQISIVELSTLSGLPATTLGKARGAILPWRSPLNVHFFTNGGVTPRSRPSGLGEDRPNCFQRVEIDGTTLPIGNRSLAWVI